MKLTKTTLDVLKNFAGINQNILISPGNVLSTRTVAKSIYATATVDTDFPQEFGIYNLTTFLGVIGIFSDPEIEMFDKYMMISQGKNKVKYNFAAPAVLDYPDKKISMSQVAASFELSEENLKSLLKAGAILSSTSLNITGDGSTIVCTVMDPKNNAANTFSVDVGVTDREFSIFIDLGNLKMITGKYNVSLSEKRIAQFSNANIDYSIFIATDKTSSWTPQ